MFRAQLSTLLGLSVSLHACVIDAERDRLTPSPRARDAALGLESEVDDSVNHSSTHDSGATSPDLETPTSRDMSAMDPLDADRALLDVEVDQQTRDMSATPALISCNVAISFTSPRDESFYDVRDSVPLRGRVETMSGDPVAGQIVQVTDERGEVIIELITDERGVFEGDYTGSSSGLKRLTASPVTEAGRCREVSELNLFLCGGLVTEDFQDEPRDWTSYGDAIWDPGGWLEMTGVSMDKKGSFYNTAETISSGFASIKFTLTTGGGVNSGGDGFAFTILELSSVDQLRSLLDVAHSGGGLGYSMGGRYAHPSIELPGDALTVEIDTWHNEFNGTNQLHTDPTRENHIAITRNADSGDHVVWFEVPNVEDLQPHTVQVELLRDKLRVIYDGRQVIEEEVSITFKGGYMFFSGSTGWATNVHRFDDLRILHACR